MRILSGGPEKIRAPQGSREVESREKFPRGPMITKLSAAAWALMALTVSGCIYVSAPPPRTVVHETRYVAPVQESVVTTLPPGYRIRVFRGARYYEYDNVYYRRHPRGYVIVGRPW